MSRARPTRASLTIERRDGSVDTIECAGANAYAGMVAHFEAVAVNGAAPIFGAPRACDWRTSSTNCIA